MERFVIVDYGFLQPQPSPSLQGNSKRVPSKSQSHPYLRKVLSRAAETIGSVQLADWFS